MSSPHLSGLSASASDTPRSSDSSDGGQSRCGPRDRQPGQTSRGFPRRTRAERNRGAIHTSDSESGESTSSTFHSTRRCSSRGTSQGHSLGHAGPLDGDSAAAPAARSGAAPSTSGGQNKYVLVRKVRERFSGADTDIVGILHHDSGMHLAALGDVRGG